MLFKISCKILAVHIKAFGNFCNGQLAMKIILHKYNNIVYSVGAATMRILPFYIKLSKKQKDYDNGVALIKAECEDAGLLPDSYIRELQYKVATEIILEIKQDKKSRAEMVAKEEGGETVTIGADSDSEIAQQMKKATDLDKGDKRTRVLRVTYLPSQARLMGDFFKKNNIEFEFLKQDF